MSGGVGFDVPGEVNGIYEMMRVDLHLDFLQNVKEHATPLAGAGVERGVEVHVTGEVENRAASGGCCASACSAILHLFVTR